MLTSNCIQNRILFYASIVYLAANYCSLIVTGNPSQNLYARDDQLNRKVAIQLNRLRPPTASAAYPAAYTRHSPPTSQPYQRHYSNSPTDSARSRVGGFGLASSADSRISLDRVSSHSEKLLFRQGNVSTSSSVYAHPSTVHQAAPSGVDMWIMGKPVRPIGAVHLHPDLTGYKLRRLRYIMAGSLDRVWTSEEQPRQLRQRAVSGTRGLTPGDASAVDEKLVDQVDKLNLTFRHALGAPYQLPDAQVKLLKEWLLDKATCEMDLIWEELSPRFWPRWIRRGVCINSPDRSCSWPPGMKCRPSGSRALDLLYWTCEDAGKTETRKQAVEQRKMRRMAAAKFHSGFSQMEPVDSSTPSDRSSHSSTRLSLRDTHQSFLASNTSVGGGNSGPADAFPSVRLALFHDRKSGRRRRAVRSLDRFGRRTARDSTLRHKSPARDRPEKRQRRVKRLIKRLSKTANGMHCFWQFQKYVISDKCSCSCS